jgi:thiol-disulfide isomerase/thioredoxin
MQKIRLTILAIFVGLLSSCANKTQKTSTGVSIEAQVTGFDSPIGLYGKNLNAELKANAEGKIKFESESMEKGFYSLSFGHENRLSLYLKPGTSLQITIDYKGLNARDKKAVQISGENSKETELLYELRFVKEKSKYSKTEAKDKYLPMVYGKNPDDFIKFHLDELAKGNQLIDDFAKKYDFEKEFVEHLKLNLLLAYNGDIRLYERMRGYLKAEKVDVPLKFEDYFADQIPQNDMELYKKHSEYASYVREKYYRIMAADLSTHIRESLPYYKAKIAFLESCNFPKIIVESMYNGLPIGYMRTRDPEVRAYLDSVIYTKVTDKESLQRYETYKSQEASYKDGDMAPDFTLIDKDGKKVSLSDFKGKMVMMDCWATWCGPCVKSLPKFVDLKNKYEGKNIVFLTISTDENIEAWRKKMGRDTKGLFEGIQLNTELNENDFKKKYMVQAIPRYILIGKDGRIIKREAPQPYSEEIIQLINKNV